MKKQYISPVLICKEKSNNLMLSGPDYQDDPFGVAELEESI